MNGTQEITGTTSAPPASIASPFDVWLKAQEENARSSVAKFLDGARENLGCFFDDCDRESAARGEAWAKAYEWLGGWANQT